MSTQEATLPKPPARRSTSKTLQPEAPLDSSARPASLSVEEMARRIAHLPPDLQEQTKAAFYLRYGGHAVTLGAAADVVVPTFYEFVQQAWHIVEPAYEYIDSEHIHHICDHLEAVTRGQIRRLLINIGPGHAKSLLVSALWPAWMWLLKPNWRVLTGSYAMELALKDAGKSRDLIQSDWYLQTYRPSWRMKKDQNQKSFYRNTETGERRVFSVGGSITGFRGNGLIIDDPLNAMAAYSETIRQGTNDWLDQAASSRLNDPRTGFIVIIMQRLHHKDMSGHVLERGGWEHLCLPTRFEPERAYRTSIGFDWRTEAGQLLFPKLFDAAAVDEIELTMGPVVFAGQHQQKPSPASGNYFKDEMLAFAWGESEKDLRFWSRDEFLRIENITEAYLSYDTATKAKTSNDYTAGSLCIGLTGGYVGVLPLVYRRMEIPDVTLDVLTRWVEWRRLFGRKLRGVFIEEGAGTAVIQYLRQARIAMNSSTAPPPLPNISQELWEKAREVDPVLALPYKTNEELVARTLRMLPWVAGRNVRLLEADSPALSRDWLKDITGFPLAPHDDATQSTYAGLRPFFEHFDGSQNGTQVATEEDIEAAIAGD